jgi:hypothetical protein
LPFDSETLGIGVGRATVDIVVSVKTPPSAMRERRFCLKSQFQVYEPVKDGRTSWENGESSVMRFEALKSHSVVTRFLQAHVLSD